MENDRMGELANRIRENINLPPQDKTQNFFFDEEPIQPMFALVLQLYKQGYWVIPCNGKQPLINWTKYQKTKPTIEEITAWWKQFPNANVGAITGKASGLAVVDVEKGGRTDDLPPTIIVETGGGGWHYHYQYPDCELKNITRFRELCDIKGEGGFVVLPPSKHSSGKLYQWAMPPELADKEEFPFELVNTEIQITKWNMRTPIPEGQRNDTAAKYAGLLLKEPKTKWNECWDILKKVNKQYFLPPLDERELQAVWSSIRKKEEPKRTEEPVKEEEKKKISEADQLYALVEENIQELFVCEEKYILLKDSDYPIIIKSEEFKDYIWNFYKQIFGKLPSPAIIEKIIQGFNSSAKKEIPIYIRSAELENQIYIDIGNSKTIEITQHNWEKINQSPVMFKKTKPLPEPTASKENPLRNLFPHITEEEFLLIEAFIIGAMINTAPILWIKGAKGCGKTYLADILKRIVDPNWSKKNKKETKKSLIISAEKEKDPYYIVCQNNLLVIVDNIDSITNEWSNIFCRTITGEDIIRRKLYTDEEEHILPIKNCLIFTGITDFIKNSDLMSRCMSISLNINNSQRKSEKKLNAEFKEKLPQILGYFYTLISGALKYKNIYQGEIPRMADFFEFAYAGFYSQSPEKAELFKQIYFENEQEEQKNLTSNDIVSRMIIDLMEESEGYHLTQTENLHKKFQKDEEYRTNIKNSSMLGKKIKIAESNLKDLYGIEIGRTRPQNKSCLTITKIKNKKSEEELKDTLVPFPTTMSDKDRKIIEEINQRTNAMTEKEQREVLKRGGIKID